MKFVEMRFVEMKFVEFVEGVGSEMRNIMSSLKFKLKVVETPTLDISVSVPFRIGQKDDKMTIFHKSLLDMIRIRLQGNLLNANSFRCIP
jgi:hypothetical protein